MTTRLVPTIVCNDIHRLNLHHVPHLHTSTFQSLQILFAQRGTGYGPLPQEYAKYYFRLYLPHESNFRDSKTFAAQLCTVKTIRRLQIVGDHHTNGHTGSWKDQFYAMNREPPPPNSPTQKITQPKINSLF